MRLIGLRRFIKERCASATIEFVVTLPMFLAALAFAFEFGQIFLAHQATVNNVRSAARYLSRSSLSSSDVDRAKAIVRTGKALDLQGSALDDKAPEYLKSENADVTVDTEYSTFSTSDFGQDGKTVRIRTEVDYPLSIFGFLDSDDRPSITFVVVEDLRFIGI